MELSPIFCPQCNQYIGLRSHRNCAQGWIREQEVKPAQAGAPTHKTTNGFNFHSHPLVAGDKLIFTYGWRGDVSGGVLVLNRADLKELWHCDVGTCVEGGAALYENTIVFGDADGRVYIMRLDGSQEVRRVNLLDGAIRSAPLVFENKLFITTLEGVIACLDARTGGMVRYTQVSGERGHAHIASAPVMTLRGALFGALDGWLYSYNEGGNNLAQVYKAPAGIYTTPVLYDGKAIITTEEGDVILVELGSHKGTNLLKTGRRIRAKPMLKDGVLYVGSQDKHLYAIDLNTGKVRWSFDCKHSISSTPLLINGLVIIADTYGNVLAVEPPVHGTTVEEPKWQFTTDREQENRESAAVLGEFLAEGEQIIFGSLDGSVYALPWHMGKYDVAINAAQRAGQHELAATYTLMAQGQDADRQAAELLSAARLHAKAARVYEWHKDLTDAAKEFEKAAAAEHLPIHWREAARLWNDVRQYKKAKTCLVNAAKESREPWLEVEVIGASAFRQGEKGWIKLSIANQLPYKACAMYLHMSGSDWTTCGVKDCPELTNADPWEEHCDGLVPHGAGDLPLQLVVDYTDELGNQRTQVWQQNIRVASPVQPAIVNQIDKMFTGQTTVTDIKGDAVLLNRGANSGTSQVTTVGGDAVVIDRGEKSNREQPPATDDAQSTDADKAPGDVKPTAGEGAVWRPES